MNLAGEVKSSAQTRWERKRGGQKGDSSLSGGGASNDRYIPNRSGMDYELTQLSYNEENSINNESQDNTSDYAKLLATVSNGDESGLGKEGANISNSRILAFKNKAPAPREGYQNSLKVLYSQYNGKKSGEVAKSTRHISSAPVRILDAPDMLDDYYLNLLSWSQTNTLAVALSQCVYLWDAASGGIKELMNVEDNAEDYISAVSWIQQGGSHIAIGTNSNIVQLWDVQAGKQVRTLDGHSSRIGALAWNSHILTSGSRDTTIINHDVRIQNHKITTFRHHTQEVCGLSWSPDGQYLASGANDNTLCIYDATSSGHAKHVLTDHQAAVKALAWCPHERGLLASGGGTADRCIKFWNASSGALVNSVDTGSQVCALQWSPVEKEILSSHGYAENQLCLWKYPTMAKVKELKGHTSRVLHMATSPDGSLVCSGAADETLRFWNVFASEGKKKSVDLAGPAAGLSRSANLRIR